MKCNACGGSGKRPLDVNGESQLLMCGNCLGSGERKSPAMGQPVVDRLGEQSLTAEELEIDRLRAELTEVRAELVAMTEHSNGQRQRRKEAEEMLVVVRAQLAGAEQIGAAAMRERVDSRARWPVTAPVDFKAIAASLPERQRAAYLALVSMPERWWPTWLVVERSKDKCASGRLHELVGMRLVECRGGTTSLYEWRVVPQVVTGREHLLHLLRGLKAMVDAPPPVFALSKEQSKLLDEVNAVLSEGTKR